MNSSIHPSVRDISSIASPLLSLLTSVLWADRRMAHTQVRALENVSRLVSDEEIAARIARGPVPYDATGFTHLDHGARALVYALAVWVAAADRRLHARERELLVALGNRLELDSTARIEQLVRDAQAVEGLTDAGLRYVIDALLGEDARRVA